MNALLDAVLDVAEVGPRVVVIAPLTRRRRRRARPAAEEVSARDAALTFELGNRLLRLELPKTIQRVMPFINTATATSETASICIDIPQYNDKTGQATIRMNRQAVLKR